MRGTASLQCKSSLELGIIPACAGNSKGCQLCEDFVRDHPRVCGEQLKVNPDMSDDEGSSPRVRGTDLGESFKYIAPGIIPACAGNS